MLLFELLFFVSIDLMRFQWSQTEINSCGGVPFRSASLIRRRLWHAKGCVYIYLRSRTPGCYWLHTPSLRVCQQRAQNFQFSCFHGYCEWTEKQLSVTQLVHFAIPFTARNDNRKLPGWSGHNRGDIFWCSSSFFLVHTSREIVFDVLLPSSSSTFLNSDVHIVFFRGDSSCCFLKRTRWRRVRTLALERRDPNT